MTDFLSLTGDERDVIAGEYVLGTLDQQSSEQVEAAMARDPHWAEAVAAWEARLRGLVALAPPEAPPADLWTQVEEAVWPGAAPSRVRFWRAKGFWQSWAIGASLAAAARSLGVLPKDPGIFRVAPGQLHAVPDMLIMISQEPEGGSPTGQPTGPVVFYGRLAAVPQPGHW